MSDSNTSSGGSSLVAPIIFGILGFGLGYLFADFLPALTASNPEVPEAPAGISTPMPDERGSLNDAGEAAQDAADQVEAGAEDASDDLNEAAKDAMGDADDAGMPG